MINASKTPSAPTINRELWVFGSNSSGQLGLLDLTSRSSPVQLTAISTTTAGTVSQIDFGYQYGLAIKTDGTLWAWGINTFGELGLGDTVTRSSPVQVGAGTNWQKVAAGPDLNQRTSYAIKTDGSMWAWGFNGAGQIGDSTVVSKSSPVQVLPTTKTNWIDVTAGKNWSAAIDSSGSLFTWGYGTLGQLGSGVADFSSPTQVGVLTNWAKVSANSSHTMAIKTDGTLWGWGRNLNGELGDFSTTTRSSPVQTGTATDWANVTAGGFFTIGVKTDGSMWAWGAGSNGQLGLALPESRPIQIMPYDFRYKDFSAGGSHAMAVKNDGTLWGWGTNTDGQLGIGNLTYKSSPVQIGALTTWKSVRCGHTHSLALVENGTLYATGLNSFNALGDLTATRRSSPVQVLPTTKKNWVDMDAGLNFSMGLDSSGSIWTWGFNGNGELGLGNTTGRTSPVQVGTLTNWSKISAANAGWYSIKTDGTLWSCGRGGFGELGNGTATNKSSPVQIGSATDWQKVAGGSYHGLAIRGTDGTGSLWSWGYNNVGQLGLGNTTNRSSPVQVGTLTNWKEVFGAHDTGGASQGRSFAIKTDGTLWGWGHNAQGQLGDGTISNTTSPVQIGTLSTWVSASGGNGFSLVMGTTSSGTASIYSMGVNSGALGRFGLSAPATVMSPVQLGTFSASDYQWSKTAISAGESHTVALKTSGSNSGSLFAWGSNTDGQLGDGTTTSKSSPVQIGALTTWVSASCGDAFSGIIRQY